MPIAILILLLGIMSAAAVVIDPTNRVDWILGSTVGVPGGIPYRSTIYRTLSASTNTATILNAAISACPSNQVILLLDGTHSMSATINIGTRHGVTIRGQSTNAIIDPSHNSTIIAIDVDPTYGAGTSITSGYAKGATNLTVASTTGLNINDIVKIDQLLDTNSMWSSDGVVRAVKQHARIDNIAGSVVTIWPPLFYGLITSPGGGSPLMKTQSPQPNRLSSLENLTINGTGQTTVWGVLLNNTYGFWMTNVMTVKVNNYHVYSLNTLFNEFASVFINDSPDYEPNHGGILLGNGSDVAATATAIYDCVFNKILPGIEVNGGSAGCVVAYNYFRDPRYGATAQAVGLNINHGPVNIANLYEGNIANMIQSDGYFGGSMKDVIFRNWSTGWTETFTNFNSRPLYLTHWTRWAQVVGNVFGCTNITADQLRLTGNGVGYETSCIYALGYPSGGNGDYDGIMPPDVENNPTFLCMDTWVTNTMNLHGNWESFTKTVTWDAGNADHSLPDSMYLASKPGWFGNLTWPPFTPANGYTNLHWTSIPAGYRYVNGTNPPAGGGGDITSQPQTRYRIRGIRLRQ